MKTYLGDCLEIMKTLPDQSIDMVLADPPYGTTACKWDSIIPFEPMWTELKRLAKPKAAICLFGSEPFSTTLRASNIDEFKYDWIWRKEQGTDFQLANRKPLKDYENISVFADGTPAYSPQGLESCGRTKRAKTDNLGHLSEVSKRDHVQAWKNYPRQVIEFSRDAKRVHPTQKPVALLEYLIKTYTKHGETVLDFCMGSGSTGVACVNTGRDFIGIEKEEKYFKIANDRIDFHSVHPMDSSKGAV